jgi:hypothetical protein
MKTLDNKLIIYDSNCYLCRTGARLSDKYSFVPSEKLAAYNDLPPELRSKVHLPSFRNEMAVIDTRSGNTLYGLDGILYVLGTRYKALKKVRTGGVLYRIIRMLYRTVSYNRYIMFPPRSLFKCDCQPPLNRRYRLLLFAFCGLAALIISSLLGISIAFNSGLPVKRSVLATLAAVGSGWVIQILTAKTALKEETFYDYLGHLGVIMLTGVLILVPALTAYFLGPFVFYPLIALFILTSCVTMTRMHYRRVVALQISQAWTYSWFLILQMSVMLTLFLVL